jgi:hypothetical protein
MELFLAIAVLLADDKFVVTDELRTEPTPIASTVIPARPLIELDASAVAAMTAASEGMIKAYKPKSFVCPQCPRHEARIGTGDADVRVEWVHEDFRTTLERSSKGVVRPISYPVFEFANGQTWDWDVYPDWDKLKAKAMELSPVAAASAPITGSINAKSTIDGFLATVKAFGGDRIELTLSHAGKGWIDCGQVSVLIPSGCKATVVVGTSSRITFSGTKPRVRLLAIDQPIDGVLYDGGKVTVDFSGWLMPDGEFVVR